MSNKPNVHSGHQAPAAEHASDNVNDVNPAAGEATIEASASNKPAKVKSDAPEGPKLPRGITETQVIRLQSDKDGKQYGAENNPKRPGSKAAVRFALYKDGMTVRQALEAGLDPGDLAYDSNKQFIVLEAAA